MRRPWAAARGHGLAKQQLGIMYENGFGVPKDYSKARELYEEAVTSGYPFTKLLLDDLLVKMKAKKKK
jgi:TPR repeat protein